MEADIIRSRVETAWQDACVNWKDGYASRYQTAVISELENNLERIKAASVRLNEAINTALSSLQEYYD